MPDPSLTPPPLPSADPPTPSWRIAVAWLVILIVVIACIALGQWRRSNRTAAPAADSPGIQMRLAGRYFVGLHLLLANKSSDIHVNSPAAGPHLQSQIDATARTPADRIAAAVVASMLIDTPTALGRLRAITERERNIGDAASDAAMLAQLMQQGESAVGDATRRSLVDRYGWFADVAMTRTLPDTDARRSAVTAAAVRTMAAVIVITLGVLALLVAGAVLLILVLIWKIKGKLPARYQPLRTGPRGAYLEAFAGYLLVFMSLSILAGLLMHTTGSLAWYALPVVSLVFGIWPLWRGESVWQWRQAMGWHRGAGVGREILAGLFGYIAGVPVVVIGALLVWIISRVSGQPTVAHPMTRWIAEAGPWGIVGLYLLACVWAPVVEESFFRGALQHHLRRRWNWLISAAVMSLIFAAIHPQGLIGIPVLFAIAMVLSAIREWRGSIIASMTAHALTNGLTMTLLLLISH